MQCEDASHAASGRPAGINSESESADDEAGHTGQTLMHAALASGAGRSLWGFLKIHRHTHTRTDISHSLAG